MRRAIAFLHLLAIAVSAHADAPATLPVLQHIPDNAMFTLALPPLAQLEERVRAFTARATASGLDLDAPLAQGLKALAEASGNPGADRAAALALAFGFNPDLPAGLFLDFTPLAKTAQEAANIAAKPSPWLHVRSGGANRGLPELGLADGVLMLGCADPARALPAAKGLAAALAQSGEAREIIIGGAAASAFGEVVVCVSGAWLYLSNNAKMLEAVLARNAAPVQSRYESADPMELLALTRLDRVHALVPRIVDIVDVVYGAEVPWVSNWRDDAIHYPPDLYDGADPCITSLAIRPDAVEFKARFDLDTHPAFAKHTGQAPPARLAGLLPEKAQAVAAFGLNAEYRTLIKERLLPKPPPGALEVTELKIAEQVLELADEVCIAIVPQEKPVLCAMLRSHNAPELWKTAGDLVPMQPGAMSLSNAKTALVPLPNLSLHAGMLGDTIAVTNDAVILTELFARVGAKPQQGWLSLRQPAIDPAAGIVGLISVEPGALPAVLELAGTTGIPMPDAIKGASQIAGKAVREIRAGKIVESHRQNVFASIYLK